MARNKNNVSGVFKQLTNSVAGINLSNQLKPTSLGRSSSGASGNVAKPPSQRDTRKLSMGAKTSPTGIHFGRHANSKRSSSSSGSAWTGLLTQTASGSGGSPLSSGLSSFAGIGGLFSGIMSLFGGGGKSTPPPLVEFQLPNSISQTMYVGSKGSSSYQGNAVETPSAAGAVTTGAPGNLLQYQSAAIAQAVKTALLNSSSLNDVIAEI